MQVYIFCNFRVTPIVELDSKNEFIKLFRIAWPFQFQQFLHPNIIMRLTITWQIIKVQSYVSTNLYYALFETQSNWKT